MRLFDLFRTAAERKLFAAVFAFAALVLSASSAIAQTLPLPERPPNAPGGKQFAREIEALPQPDRETQIIRQILSGNVPRFLRQFRPVNITNTLNGSVHTAKIFVAPDYLSVGDDVDFFLTPLTPGAAQRIANALDCALPTPKMVDLIYAAAPVKLEPLPLTPSAAMTTVPVFITHNEMVRTQRLALAPNQLTELTAGHKKDVVVCARLAQSPGRVAIYGWHRPGGKPIQPLYLGHTSAWADYSHGIRLVNRKMFVDGNETTVARVLADPTLCALLSDEGVVTSAHYPARATPAQGEQDGASATIQFHETGRFGEREARFNFEPETHIAVNAPGPADFQPAKPVLLIIYTTPNGNTLDQTLGHALKPGEDWHFDIQHIAAQTRFLRTVITNRTIVLACLQAESMSWPTWRAEHGDAPILPIIERVKTIFPTNKIEIALAGHSGGGSFIFGYLNAIGKIPDEVTRIAFLDSNYAYESARGHDATLAGWLKTSDRHFLCVLAYDDASALLDGKPFITPEGGTWGRSHAMLKDLSTRFTFNSVTNGAGLDEYSALDRRIEFFLKQNPGRKVLHTVQVERNGFIHAMLAGTPDEARGYEYFGPRAYTKWISSE
jgi:hypothetical protein